MTVRLLVGDVHERLADIPDRSVDLRNDGRTTPQAEDDGA